MKGAWYKKPEKLKFSYMPSNQGLQKDIISHGKSKLDLIWMIKEDEKLDAKLREKFSEEFLVRQPISLLPKIPKIPVN